jgi:hypothetical protein
MASFTTYKTDTINTTTGTTLVTCGAGQHFLHSAYITNIEGSAMPITLEIVHADTTVTHVAHKRKIFPNETVDLVSQNKIYLLNGDALKVKADRASAFTVTVSLLDQAI